MCEAMSSGYALHMCFEEYKRACHLADWLERLL